MGADATGELRTGTWVDGAVEPVKPLEPLEPLDGDVSAVA